MARALLIAEKPDLMRHVKSAYDKYGHKDIIEFESFAGHTMTLQTPEMYNSEWGGKWKLDNLPMIPNEFKYMPTKDKLSLYKRIKDKIKKGNYDYLINCCDPGREGNHIFHSFYETIGCKLPVKRMWHSDLTENELKRALNNLRDDINEPELKNMTIASKLRADFDWLTGLNFTRVLTVKGNKLCNVGRVMTPILKIIVDRELELRNFIPKDFWEIEATFDGYKGTYYTKDGKGQFLDKSKAENVIKPLGKKGFVQSIEQKKEVRYAPRLHSLAELQNEANKVYGYTMQETLGIVQNLYEKKILSYPRTDSSYVTKAIAKDFRTVLSALLNISELKQVATKVMNDTKILSDIVSNKRYVDDKKVSDHYAIIPTGEDFVFSNLDTKEKNIVLLVGKRLLSIFMKPMTSNKTNIETNVNGAIFKTTGSILVDKGFTELYNATFNNNTLPLLKKGDEVNVKSIDLIGKKTSPPQRYTDETLNKSMENAGKFVEDEDLKEVLKEAKGLGTPATRGGIVEKLVILKMVERKKKNFYATDYGISIIQSLGDFDITSPELTGIWEQKLREIEACKYNPKQFRDEMVEYVKDSTEKLKNFSVTLDSSEESLGKCPICGRNVKEGKSYYFCSAYKKGCDFIVSKDMFGAKISKTEIKKILVGKETKEFTFKNKGKSWSCKLVYSPIEKKVVFANSSNSKSKDLGKCPVCGEPIKEGKTYYMCSKYKDGCNFIFNKEYSGSKLTEKDVKTLMDKKKIRKKFTWKSGKSGEANLIVKNGKVEFDFS